jgi:hypothetical protein
MPADCTKPVAANTDCSALPEVDYTVTVTFTGLEVFVDSRLNSTDEIKPIDLASYKPAPMTVVLPNVKSGRPYDIPVTTGDEKLRNHTPFIGADTKYICPATTATLRQWTPVPTSLFHEFDGEAVIWDEEAIKDRNGADPTYSMDYNKAGDKVCPVDAADAKSLFWMSHLGEVIKETGVGSAKADLYLQKVPDPKDISARVPIDHGALEMCIRSKLIWNYRAKKQAPSKLSRVIGQEVKYTLKGHGSLFHVGLKKFADGTTSELVFKPVMNDKREYVIELRIANLMCDTLFPGNPSAKHPLPGSDAHFAVYFDGVKPPIAADDRPIPFFQTACSTNPAAFCNLVTFDPPESAHAPNNSKHPSGRPPTLSAEGINCGPTGLP